MKIDYVCMGSTQNPEYLDYWPIVSEVWYKKFNIIPVLGIISDEDGDFEKSHYGIIKKIKKGGNQSEVTCSQVVRLYLPKFLNGTVLVSDLDMIPLSTKYFIDDISEIQNDKFIIFSSHHEQTQGNGQYPMCYVAGHSNTYSQIFDYNLNFIDFMENLPNKGWYADQIFLYNKVQNFDKEKLEFPYRQWGHNSLRIDRSNWVYDEELLKKGHYIDSHLLRPYTSNKERIDKLVCTFLES